MEFLIRYADFKYHRYRAGTEDPEVNSSRIPDVGNVGMEAFSFTLTDDACQIISKPSVRVGHQYAYSYAHLGYRLAGPNYWVAGSLTHQDDQKSCSWGQLSPYHNIDIKV